MAAYDLNTDFTIDCEKKLVNMNNTIDRKILLDIIDILDDELIAVEDGQTGYTLQVTSLQAQKKLSNLSDCFRTDIMMLFINDIWTELALVVTNGNSYTKTDGIVADLKRRFDNMPDILVKQVMHDLVDIIDTELDAMEASDADS